MSDYAALMKGRREMEDSKKYADKLAGVLIQIDNMVTVLLKERKAP